MTTTQSPTPPDPQAEVPVKRKKVSTHWLYIAVIVAVVAGIAVGLIFGKQAAGLAVIGTAFVNLIKMMIGPIIFCTIVLGIGSVRKASQVGKVGGLALLYFIVMSTFALFLGLLVGNLITPGDALKTAASTATYTVPEVETSGNFLIDIIPTTLVSALTSGSVLEALFVALLVGFAVQALGAKGQPVLNAVTVLQRLVFKILAGIMWLAPIGAFGAIAGVVGNAGWAAIGALGLFVLTFYATCIVFIVVILGGLLKVTTGFSIFKVLYYLRQEYLLIVATSSSETALPRLIAKLEHLGVSRPVVGIVVPTGYSFNLDGTAMYLTMASLFISNALGMPLSWSEQLSLLVFMIVASKGAAGVTGAGLAVLGGGLASHAPALVPGVGLVVAVDRFMSEARALTNFSGNAVATLVIGHWVKEIDRPQANRVFTGEDPFDDTDMLDEHSAEEHRADATAYKKTRTSPPPTDHRLVVSAAQHDGPHRFSRCGPSAVSGDGTCPTHPREPLTRAAPRTPDRQLTVVEWTSGRTSAALSTRDPHTRRQRGWPLFDQDKSLTRRSAVRNHPKRSSSAGRNLPRALSIVLPPTLPVGRLTGVVMSHGTGGLGT